MFMKYLIDATVWRNASALATVAHFLTENLSSPQWEAYTKLPAYQTLLQSFRDIYKRPNANWSNIKQAIHTYIHPQDQQMIWILPLSKLLNKTSNVTVLELSTLCDTLHISLKVQDATHIEGYYCGYAGQDALGTLNAINIGQEWWPLDEKNTAEQYNTIWRYGTPHLIFLSDQQMIKEIAVYFEYTAPKGLSTLKKLNALIANRSFDNLAKQISQSKTLFSLNGAGLEAIYDAIAQADIPLILTFYRFNSNARNTILKKCIYEPYPLLLSKICHYDAKIRKNTGTVDNWHKTLDTLIEVLDNPIGDTPLHSAIRQNKTQLALNLIKQEEHNHSGNASFITPLHLICAQNNVTLLKAYKPNQQYCTLLVYDKFSSAQSPFQYALEKSSSAVLDHIFGQHTLSIDSDVRDNHGRTLLHVATLYATPQVLQKPFFRKLVNVQDPAGYSPLHYAVTIGSIKKIQALLAIGADPSLRSTAAGFAALTLAMELRKFDCIEALVINKQTLLEHYDSEGQTVIHYAAHHGHLSLLKSFCTKFGDNAVIHCVDKLGRYPLHSAAENGNAGIVKLICEKGKELNNQIPIITQWSYKLVPALNTVAIKMNSVLQSKITIYPLFDVNARNGTQQTPYMLAAINGHAAVIEELLKHNAIATSLYNLLIDAIYYQKNALLTNVDHESMVANIIQHHASLVYTTPLVHHCVQTQQYRMAHILLHPLTPAQRALALQMKNDAGLTPLELLQQLKQKKGANEAFDKLERLFLHYDKAAYAAKYKTLKEKVEYHFQWNQDVKAELMSSSSYRILSTGIMVGPAAFQFAVGAVTGGAWLGMEMAVAQFGIDPITTIERGFNMLVPNLSKVAATATKVAQYTFSGIGLYRHTTRRIVVEGVRQMAALALSQINPHILEIMRRNYFNYLNAAGMLFIIAEEGLGNTAFGPYLEQYWSSIESTLKSNFDISTTAELANMLGEAMNSGVEALIGVNIKATVKANYEWARENIGGLPSPATIFQQQVESTFMGCIFVEDEQIRVHIRDGAKAIYIQHYNDPHLTSLLQNYAAYVNTGKPTTEGLQIFYESAVLIHAQGKDVGDYVAALSTSNALSQGTYVGEQDLNIIHQEIQAKINAQFANGGICDIVAFTGIVNQSFQLSISAYAKGYVERKVLPNIETADQNVIDTVRTASNILINHSFKEGTLLETQLNDFVAYVNEGTINASFANTVNIIATYQQSQGLDYSNAVSSIILCNQSIQDFHFLPVKMAELNLHIAEQINNQVPLEQVITTSYDKARSDYVQTKPSGETVSYDYENILGNKKHINVDGRSTYMSESLISNNLYQFGGMSQDEKAAALYAFKNYLVTKQNEKIVKSGQEVLGLFGYNGLAQGQEAAAINAYNALSAFLRVEPFVASFCKGESLSDNNRAILSQFSPTIVYASFAVHELNLALTESRGYAPLTFPQEVKLFELFMKEFHGSEQGISQQFNNIIVETIQNQAVASGDYQPVWGLSIDNAASYINASAHNAGTNNWTNTPEALTRSMDIQKPSFIKKFVHDVVGVAAIEVGTVLVNNLGVGIITNGQQVTAGIQNNQTGEMTDLSVTFNKKDPNPAFSLGNTNPQQHATFQFENLDLAQMQQANDAVFKVAFGDSVKPYDYTTFPTQSPISQWLDATMLERLASTMYWSGDVSYYTQDFTAEFSKYINELKTPKAVPKKSSMPEKLVKSGQGVCFVPEQPEQGVISKAGQKVLDYIIPTADAAVFLVPLAVCAGEVLAGTALAAGVTAEVMAVVGGTAAAAGVAATGAYYLNQRAKNDSQLDDFLNAEFDNHSLLQNNSSFNTGALPLYEVYKKNNKKGNGNERPNRPDPDKKHISAPDFLPGFPKVKEAKGKTPYPGGIRKRWKTRDGRILEWDYRHGEIELYDKWGKHLGAYNPNTGVQTKPPKKNRRIEP